MARSRIAIRGLSWLVLACTAGEAVELLAQLPAPQDYSTYYNRELDQLGRPNTNPGLYTYNRMFYHNPAISPYSNLLRSPGYGTTAYQQYVLPEEQRRTNFEDKSLERRAPGGTGNAGLVSPQGTGVPSSGAYQNHWYGSRQQMGL